MPTFLTVKEASSLTGKSSSSIRRIIYPIVKDANHADRNQIEPSVADVRALRIKGENFAWKLSEDLLRREIPAQSESEQGSPLAPKSPSSDANAELLVMLRHELDIKNKQIESQADVIAKQMEVISGLGERIRESNHLIGSLQKQLSPPTATPPRQDAIVDAKSSNAPPTEKRAKKESKQPKQKRGFLNWLVR